MYLVKFWLTTLVALTSLSCSEIWDYIPRGETLKTDASESVWLQRNRAPIIYTDAYPENSTHGLIVPLQTFAAHYKRDLFIKTKNPNWSMHEFAKIDIYGKRMWIAKDADENGVQTVTANLEAIDTWLPEIPIPRQRGIVKVIDRATDKSQYQDLKVSYINPHGEHVIATFKSKLSTTRRRLRNGSTFDHSADYVAVLLDIPSKRDNFFKREPVGSRIYASVTYDDKAYDIETIGGVKILGLLQQTQVGIAVTSMRQTSLKHGIHVVRPIPGENGWNTRAIEVWQSGNQGDDGTTAQVTYERGNLKWIYDFKVGGLSRITITEQGLDIPRLDLVLSKQLPDLRRTFSGEVKRNFVLKVNGLRHGHGTIIAFADGNKRVVRFLPLKPYWFRNRPMEATVTFVDDQTVDVRTIRLPSPLD